MNYQKIVTPYLYKNIAASGVIKFLLLNFLLCRPVYIKTNAPVTIIFINATGTSTFQPRAIS
jgi:hypothetical protein